MKSKFSPYQKECAEFVIRSICHETSPQKVCKSTLSAFDEKRCYIKETGSTP